MGGINYRRMEQTARRMISENGLDVVLERKIGGNAERLNVKGVRSAYDKHVIDNKLIFGTDIKLLTPASVEPKEADKVYIGGEFVGTIQKVKKIAPGPVTVMHESQVRI